jgi:IclR family transcriptional regulator, acetate operon repressor
MPKTVSAGGAAPTAAGPEARTGTQAIERAVAVLGSFDDVPDLAVSEIAHRVDLSVSTTHRIVRALCNAGLIDQDPFTERYALGPRLAQLGQLVWDRMGLGGARPLLQQLADTTGESVNLGVRRGAEVVVLLWAESVQPLRFDQPPGSHVPLHSSAMGKALLAFEDDPAQAVRDLPRLSTFTPNTISRRSDLLEDLVRIRARGWSMNDEERNIGVRAVGAPVLASDGKVRAAVSLQGPAVRLPDDRVAELAPVITETATRLAGVLPLARL